MEGAVKYNIRKERLGNKQESSWGTQAEEAFRNTIATVDEKGKRIWIHPNKPSGKYHQWRIAVTVVLLSILFAGPFLKINGQPFLLLNVFERKFVILGQAFWPQDFFLLAIVMITFFVFIILFTVVFGRVWCGWMCPQTLFMEMVFRKIEYLIEGDAPAQRRLAKEPWNFNKVWKKTLKHTIFIIISLLISHTAMAYLIGIDQTLSIINHSPSENIAGFIGLVAFTGIFYGLFAKFREQACIAVCPYGRLQGVLLTKESIVVAYDWLRGEPRGKMKKNQAEKTSTGDCIDCKLCVHVCPTGIDIRNGTQLECVNCTACIDACDQVMLKIGKPKGLIRYASYNSIKDGIAKIITTRVIGYSFVLLILMGILSFALITRSDVETTVLKVPGTLYQREPGYITNLYNVEFVNKTFEKLSVEVKVESPATAEFNKVDGKQIIIPAEGIAKSVYFIRIPEEDVTNARTVVKLGIYHNGKKIETVKAKFIGPVSKASDAKRN
ncbi:cytochrome c oxidase accessory protein CcoG [Chryseosolibacter indicus]|uniref:Cytochrome c oxidase accessory protein CcoG n=1 Tax=Chryseosolibacter indicus TaxID=2782351 RepID=A0ABS5VQM3_9BACT|nr:cytochrome c oxidase accessory protein CcoG [Chryseosolibacter indicus]MBT1703750.1 cytochrome c oxidase accessory protein CcoG [Chryseosolibacter indicus]